MVEYTINYDSVFQALADGTRRDILWRVGAGEQTITELARHYSMSFAAVAKHLKVLESAALVLKRKHGRTQVVAANPQTIAGAAEHLRRYEMMWDQRFDKMEQLLKEKV